MTMKPAVIGFDTSNYRTSAAAVTPEGDILFSYRELLKVAPGERGLRQNDAVFAHLKQITGAAGLIRERLRDYEVVAIAVSSRPRDNRESYMPVFQVGVALGTVMAAAFDVPLYQTSHQRGHLEAAAWGTPLQEAAHYLALHLSGGTTDLLRVDENGIETLGSSLDLHAGQLVDRAGVALGLPFPSGEKLEELARAGESAGRLGCSMENGDLSCHLSGAESQVQRWIRDESLPREDIAREIYDLLARTVARMTAAGIRKTGEKTVLVTGGIASSALFGEMLGARCGKTVRGCRLVFGKPEMSGDNACGTALAGMKAWKKTATENAGGTDK